jgi:hypothetical protein
LFVFIIDSGVALVPDLCRRVVACGEHDRKRHDWAHLGNVPLPCGRKEAALLLLGTNSQKYSTGGFSNVSALSTFTEILKCQCPKYIYYIVNVPRARTFENIVNVKALTSENFWQAPWLRTLPTNFHHALAYTDEDMAHFQASPFKELRSRKKANVEQEYRETVQPLLAKLPPKLDATAQVLVLTL